MTEGTEIRTPRIVPYPKFPGEDKFLAMVPEEGRLYVWIVLRFWAQQNEEDWGENGKVKRLCMDIARIASRTTLEEALTYLESEQLIRPDTRSLHPDLHKRYERLEDLFYKGYKDREIAASIGLSPRQVRRDKAKLGLKSRE